VFGITAFAQSPFAALGGSAYNEAVGESVASADVVSISLTQAPTIFEFISVVDTQVSDQTLAALISESTSSVDTLSNILLGVAFQDESMLAAENIAQLTGKFVTVADSVSTNDTFAVINNVFNITVSEATTPSDTDSSSGLILIEEVDEVMDIVDTKTGVFVFGRGVAESVAVADNMTFAASTKAFPTGVVINLSVNNVNVWGDINDDADPNWVIIQD
jgi:hypothetical protein